MGRHHRAGSLDELLAAGLAPAPRTPGDVLICPACQSGRTVHYGSRAHCGDCRHEWLLDSGDLPAQQQARYTARRRLDDWAEQLPDQPPAAQDPASG
ncbi:MAG TPA: hypothetical protein VMU51_38555 [Mycobacteriales bacterium]|nr:hypothetical protein [Mycobacteriales bacterium]